MNSEQIAQMIRHHRKKQGWTQAELAQRAQLGKTVVFDIEKGKPTIRLDTLLKVLTTLDITLEFKEPDIQALAQKWVVGAGVEKKKSGWISKIFSRN